MGLHRPLDCCGIAEYDGIIGEEPETILKDIACDIFSELEEYDYYEGEAEYQAPFIVFSDTRKIEDGRALEAYIKKNKLGTVIHTTTRINPRSGNPLRMWVWTWNKSNLKKWYLKNK